jgi:hypothetical protein
MDRMDQCSILYVNSRDDDQQVRGLRELGFHVDAARDLPPNEALVQYHAVLVRAHSDSQLTMLAARLRAKPKFGRRVLLALVAEGFAEREKREVILSGFDETVPAACSVRDLAATILRLLRPFPEYRCILRSPTGRRKAA